MSPMKPMFNPDYEHIPIKIFTSYTHKEENHREDLDDALAMIRRQPNIESWNDRGGIAAGDEWDEKIQEALDTSDIILLLFSTKFLASTYIYDVEMARAIERHKDEDDHVRVIPVILKPCQWTTTQFSMLQAVPKDAKPILDWDSEDRAYLDVAKKITIAIEESRRKKAENMKK